MSRLDDRLTSELERAARPASPTGAFEQVERKHARRGRLRKLEAGALVVVVLAGTLGGVALLSKAFHDGVTGTPVGPGVTNGLLVVAVPDALGLTDLYSIDPLTGQRTRLTTSPPGDWASQPAVSPDGRTIAYTLELGDRPTIELVSIDGGSPTPLTDTTWGARDPAWSPDGSKIAFDGVVDGRRGLFAIDVRTRDVSTIWAPAALSPSDPAWSPDGRTVAVVGSAATVLDLFAVDVESGSATRLMSTPRLNELHPSWSPDGTQIVFSQTPVTSHTVSGGLEIMNADGTGARPLTAGGIYDGTPSWSPDGTLIAFGRLIEERASTIYVVRPDGSGLTSLGEGINPAWQPLPAGSSGATASESPSPSSSGPVNIGLAFPVCNVRTMTGDFDGNGTLDTFYTATKMSDASGCPAPGTATEVLAVDLNGDGKVDASGGPPACPGGCESFAAPDIDGDGTAEIAIVVDRPADGTERIQLWRVVPAPPGGSTAILPLIDASGMPATFTWGSDGTNTYGVSCTTRTTPPLLIEWQAIPTGQASWHVSEHGYHIVDTNLRSAFEDSYDVPGEETVFPDGGGSTMCGAPVVASLSAPVVATSSPSVS